MARMKFICDAERCIECNGCVTACKNEHDVPWGVNRRRVVTLNDGVPGEKQHLGGLHALHATRPAWRSARSTASTAPTKAWCCTTRTSASAAATARYACPFGAPQFPTNGTFGLRGKMDKCTFCAGGPEANGSAGRVREVRPQPPGRRQAAGLRRDVLDQGAARRRRRRGGRHLPHPRAEARQGQRGLGLGHGLRQAAHGGAAPAEPRRPSHERSLVIVCAGRWRCCWPPAARSRRPTADATQGRRAGLAGRRQRPYAAPGWKPGDKASWEAADAQRARRARTSTPRVALKCRSTLPCEETPCTRSIAHGSLLLALAAAGAGAQACGAGASRTAAGAGRSRPAGAASSRRPSPSPTRPTPQRAKSPARQQRAVLARRARVGHSSRASPACRAPRRAC